MCRYPNVPQEDRTYEWDTKLVDTDSLRFFVIDTHQLSAKYINLDSESVSFTKSATNEIRCAYNALVDTGDLRGGLSAVRLEILPSTSNASVFSSRLARTRVCGSCVFRQAWVLVAWERIRGDLDLLGKIQGASQNLQERSLAQAVFFGQIADPFELTRMIREILEVSSRRPERETLLLEFICDLLSSVEVGSYIHVISVENELSSLAQAYDRDDFLTAQALFLTAQAWGEIFCPVKQVIIDFKLATASRVWALDDGPLKRKIHGLFSGICEVLENDVWGLREFWC